MSSLNNNIAAIQLLTVTRLSNSLVNNFDEISIIMDQLPRHQLLNNSWPQYKTICAAGFSIAHTDSEILIKFYIVNDHFGSKIRDLNGAVHEDNCVEFFVCFDGEQAYYNIEFNCLGIGKMAYGKKSKRNFLPEDTIRTIKTWVRSNNTNKVFDWEMTLSIPATAFTYHQINLQQQLSCRGNFYKCGDGLPTPHYLTWNKIEVPAPDFHRADFFGDIVFENVVLEEDHPQNITTVEKTFFNH